MRHAGYPFTFEKRVALGMAFAVAAMMAAGVVEHYRLESFWPDPIHLCRNNSIEQVIGKSFLLNCSIFYISLRLLSISEDVSKT